MGSERICAETGRLALEVALTRTREDERILINKLNKNGILSVAVDFGGDFVKTIPKILESIVVGARRQHVIVEDYIEEAAVLGASRLALEQLKIKGIGCSVGGKASVVRCGENLCVAIYMQIGIINLDDMAIGLAHRAIRKGY